MTICSAPSPVFGDCSNFRMLISLAKPASRAAIPADSMTRVAVASLISMTRVRATK